jgi:exopolyphosphatase/guanosine-5'-triphosphate,3'-diphosphate pyrophosphatase
MTRGASGTRSVAGSRRAQLAAVRRLAATCPEHVGHARQVARLALRLFDATVELHGLGEEERFLLHSAALLHDIGWIGGQKGHHKTALRIITESPLLPVNRRERLVIASVARYHRKALPRAKHRHFAALDPDDRRLVRALSALLRVADGLDRSHTDAVRGLSCRITPEEVVVSCRTSGPIEAERAAALGKADLFEEVFGRKLVVAPPGGRRSR